MIRVLCVDDSAEIIRAMRRLLQSEPGFVAVGSLSSADDLVPVIERLRADVVLLDLSMPGRPPLDALRALTQTSLPARTIVFSGSVDDENTDIAFEAGAWGVISKQAGFAAILHAIRRVMAGEFVLPD